MGSSGCRDVFQRDHPRGLDFVAVARWASSPFPFRLRCGLGPLRGVPGASSSALPSSDRHRHRPLRSSFISGAFSALLARPPSGAVDPFDAGLAFVVQAQGQRADLCRSSRQAVPAVAAGLGHLDELLGDLCDAGPRRPGCRWCARGCSGDGGVPRKLDAPTSSGLPRLSRPSGPIQT